MKTYYYEVNGFMKGVVEAKNKWEVRKYCKYLTSLLYPNVKIKSIKVTRIKKYEPLAVEI